MPPADEDFLGALLHAIDSYYLPILGFAFLYLVIRRLTQIRGLLKDIRDTALRAEAAREADASKERIS